jgi:hypothetical protein
MTIWTKARVIARCRGAMLGVALAVGISGPVVAASDAPWGDLSPWVGHYPSDRLGPGGRSFFQNPSIAHALREVLSPADLALVLHGYPVVDQIATVGQYLILDNCAAHDCGALNATVVLDMKSVNLWVALFAHRGDVVSMRWYGTADYTDLPAPVLDAVKSVHQPSP